MNLVIQNNFFHEKKDYIFLVLHAWLVMWSYSFKTLKYIFNLKTEMWN